MPERPPIHRPAGYKPPEQRKQDSDKERLSASQRGYNSKWRKARKTYLDEHPLCVQCKSEGLLVAANIVDHITPHKGDQKLFWNTSNWQALCKSCHDIKTAREDGGFGR